MASGKFVAYYRVSTGRQGRSGLGLEAQQAAVTAWLNGGAWVLVGSFTEVESGKRADRPELMKALALCRATGAVLIVARLDRLSRSVSFISTLMESGVEFRAVDMPEASRVVLHIMSAMAQHEREMIAARTKAALAQAKQRGVKLGTPANLSNREGGTSRSAEVRAAAANARAADLAPLVADIQASGVTSAKGIAHALTARSIPTPAGKATWTHVQVKHLLARMAGLMQCNDKENGGPVLQ